MDQQVLVSLFFRRSGQQVEVILPYYMVQAFSRGSKDSQNGRQDLGSLIRLHSTCEATAEV